MRKLSFNKGLTLFSTGIVIAAAGILQIGLGAVSYTFLLSLIAVAVGFVFAIWTFSNAQWAPGERDPFDLAWWRVERILILTLALAAIVFIISLTAQGVIARIVPSWLGWPVIGILLLNVVVFVWLFLLPSFHSAEGDAEPDTPTHIPG